MEKSSSESDTAAKAVSVIMVISIVGQGLGFIREMLLANAFGASIAMDAYNTALGLVGLLPVLLVSYIQVTYIPEYTRLRINNGERASEQFFSLIMTIILILSIIISIIGYIFAPSILSLFASGFTGEVRTLSIQLMQTLVWIIPLQMVNNVFISTLNARRIHTIPVIMATSVNIFVIPAIIFLNQYWGIYTLIIATIPHLFISVYIYWRHLNEQGQKFKFLLDISHPSISKTIYLALPAVTVSATDQINQIIDRTLSSGLPQGSVAVLGYASRIAIVPMSILVPFTTVYFSKCSEQAAIDDKKSTLRLLWKTMETLLVVTLPIVVITMLMRYEIVRIIFERGAFTREATEMTARVLTVHILLILTACFTYLVGQTLLAYQDTKGMILRGVLAVIVNGIFSILLTKFFGIIGIVLGTVISSVVFAVLLGITLRKHWGPLGMFQTVREVFKMLVSVIVCGMTVYTVGNLLPVSDDTLLMDIFRFSTATIAGYVVYISATLLLKVRSMLELVLFVLKKLKQVQDKVK